jgi:hypothetical protein
MQIFSARVRHYYFALAKAIILSQRSSGFTTFKNPDFGICITLLLLEHSAMQTTLNSPVRFLIANKKRSFPEGVKSVLFFFFDSFSL